MSRSLSFQFFKKNWQQGELGLVFAALLLVSFLLSASASISLRIKQSIQGETAIAIGGKVVLRGDRVFSRNWCEEADKLNVSCASSLTTFTMARAGSKIKLTTVKAISRHYPLRGKLISTISSQALVGDTPSPGNLWADRVAMSSLKLKLGSVVHIGNKSLKFSRILLQDPVQQTGFYALSPTIIMSEADLMNSGIILPGSRLQLRLYLDGKMSSIKRVISKIRMSDDRFRITTIRSQRRFLNNVFETVQRFFQLLILFSLLLAGVVVASSSYGFTSRQRETIALLRCIGSTRKKIGFLLVGQWCVVTIPAVMIGSSLGLLAQAIVSTVLPASLSLGVASWIDYGSILLRTLLLNVVIVVGFASNHVWRLIRVDPKSALTETILQQKQNDWSPIIFMLLCFFLSWMQTEQALLAFQFTVVLVSVTAVLSFVFSGLSRFCLFFSKSRVPVVRFSLLNLLRQKERVSIFAIGIVLCLSSLSAVYFIRYSLVEQLSSNVNAKTPNVFIINLTRDQIKPFRKLLSSKEITNYVIYPNIRARLQTLNGMPILKAVKPSARYHNSLNRELNLTSTQRLPRGNQLVEGQWWSKKSSKSEVSIESGLAKTLGIKVGDEISFSLGEETIKSVVSSVRRLNWLSFRPSFYFIFSPNVLRSLPTTYMTSFFLPSSSWSLLNAISTAMPNAVVINISVALKKVLGLVDRFLTAIGLVSLFSMLLGLLIFLTSFRESALIRRNEIIVWRYIGAANLFISRMLLLESVFLSVIIATVVVALASLLAWIVCEGLLSINLQLPFSQLVGLWVLVIVLVNASTLWVRRALAKA